MKGENAPCSSIHIQHDPAALVSKPSGAGLKRKGKRTSPVDLPPFAAADDLAVSF
ncbi:MAG: hypothetical protein IJQ36_01345 [Oscillospiraceae bacterium]|jgi:hypothetical protein|nr:hypothetical protein [Oscillospiraceae bacterium]